MFTARIFILIMSLGSLIYDAEALIKTFKTLSSDELINVYPHPFIEFTEYDHPGMYQRIKAIREAEKK